MSYQIVQTPIKHMMTLGFCMFLQAVHNRHSIVMRGQIAKTRMKILMKMLDHNRLRVIGTVTYR